MSENIKDPHPRGYVGAAQRFGVTDFKEEAAEARIRTMRRDLKRLTAPKVTTVTTTRTPNF